MSDLNQFDRIAGLYDVLASAIFGRSMRKAQFHHLKNLPREGKVLILGGGTGWHALELLRNSAVTIVYIDASRAMLSMAEKKLSDFRARVKFIHGTASSVPPEKFDAVITNFYLDLFDQSTLEKVVALVRGAMHRDSGWVITDFVRGRWWHNFLLKVMYFFFRVTCNIQAPQLPAWENTVEAAGFRSAGEAFYYGEFIKTVLVKITG
jgi:tRNA (cmo5U34)-methyltransferase